MEIIQISSANGPKECEIAIEKCLQFILKEVAYYDIEVEILEFNQAADKIGYKSILIGLIGKNACHYAQKWHGTHQWQCQSSVRPFHKRKNWLFGCYVYAHADNEGQISEIHQADITVKTCKASGAGGQHVNKTDSAVIMTHEPTGLQVKVSSHRSQHQNKQLAYRLLLEKLSKQKQNQSLKSKNTLRMHHHQIYPNTPKRSFKGENFQEV